LNKRQTTRAIIYASILAGGIFSCAISALAANVLPGAASPGTVRQSLSKQNPNSPPAASQLQSPTVPQPQQAAASAAAQKVTFKLEQIKLIGNHIYSTEELSAIYKDKLHKVISVADLFQIEEDITAFYRNNGYILSRAILPPQQLHNGIVTIQIIEGYIDKITISGNPQGAKPIVESFGNQIMKDRPVQLSHLEKYLMLLNEIPATTVKGVFSPSTSNVGAATFDLDTDHSLVTGYVSYDNYGTAYIGPQQMTGNINLNSLFISGDTTQFTLIKTPQESELTYAALNYGVPIDSEGNNIQIGGNSDKTRPQFVLEPEEIVGISSLYYLGLQHPMIRTPTQSLTVHSTFNYESSNTTILGAQLYTDEMRTIELGAVYTISDSWRGSNNITANFEQGLPILGYSSDTNPATAQTSNPGGTAVFTKVDFQMSRLQQVKGPFSVLALVSGQWSLDPLLATEQYSYGGPIQGRGYETGELVGDSGLAGTAELHYDLSVNKFFISGVQFYTFYDIGMIENHVVTPNTIKSQSASSTGGGARFALSKYITGNIVWAQPLTRRVAAEVLADGGTGNGYAPTVLFSLVATMD